MMGCIKLWDVENYTMVKIMGCIKLWDVENNGMDKIMGCIPERRCCELGPNCFMASWSCRSLSSKSACNVRHLGGKNRTTLVAH